MKKEEAVKILEDKLSEYRQTPYSVLINKLGEIENFESETEKGEPFQIEIEFVTDDEEVKSVRVTGSISYSGWTDFFPVCSDFIVSPDGKFIGE